MSGIGTMQGVDVPSRVLAIPAEMGELSKATEELVAQLAQLESRLAPVLGPSAARAGEAINKNANGSLAGELRTISVRILGAASAIIEIKGRLEL